MSQGAHRQCSGIASRVAVCIEETKNASSLAPLLHPCSLTAAAPLQDINSNGIAFLAAWARLVTETLRARYAARSKSLDTQKSTRPCHHCPGHFCVSIICDGRLLRGCGALSSGERRSALPLAVGQAPGLNAKALAVKSHSFCSRIYIEPSTQRRASGCRVSLLFVAWAKQGPSRPLGGCICWRGQS